MDLSHISVIGWLVILVAIVLIFILAWFKGLHISKDGASTNIDKKLNEYENTRARDENKRIDLFKIINGIDEKEKSDLILSVETVKKQIKQLIRSQIKCGVALNHIVDKITLALNIKIDEDDFRRRLDPNNIEVYKKDVLVAIEFEYEEIKRQTEKTECSEQLDSFTTIKDLVRDIIDSWCNTIRENVIFSCNEKIKIYEQYMDAFTLDTYRDHFVSSPLIKNKAYLERLTIKPKAIKR